jgi:hypothetical protein
MSHKQPERKKPPTLSLLLSQLGFVQVTGSTEIIAGVARRSAKGTPYTYDGSGNTVVVYDQFGEAWVRLGQLTELSTCYDAIFAHKLCQGAYVPHSSDGGVWIRDRFNFAKRWPQPQASP